MSLNALLPQPKREYEVLPSRNERAQAQATTSSGGGPPPYGQRQGFVPRTQADFGDGGAFPEILVAQYPRDMGRPGKVSVGIGGRRDLGRRLAGSHTAPHFAVLLPCPFLSCRSLPPPSSLSPWTRRPAVLALTPSC